MTKLCSASTANLASLRNKLAFINTAKMPGVLDQRLNADIRQFEIAAFSLELLEALWRDKQDPGLLY